MKFLLTLQGPTVDGNIVLESWEIEEVMYLHMRSHMASEPLATTLTDTCGGVMSQRFSGDDNAEA